MKTQAYGLLLLLLPPLLYARINKNPFYGVCTGIFPAVLSGSSIQLYSYQEREFSFAKEEIRKREKISPGEESLDTTLFPRKLFQEEQEKKIKRKVATVVICILFVSVDTRKPLMN